MDRDLAGRLTKTFCFFFCVSRSPQRKEQQTNWAVPAPLHALLTEIARLAQQQECQESKRAADLCRVCIPSSSLLSLPAPTSYLFFCTPFYIYTHTHTLGVVNSPTHNAAAPASRKTATTFFTTTTTYQRRRRTAAN